MLSGWKFKTDNNKNKLIIKLKTNMDKETQVPTLGKTAVISRFYIFLVKYILLKPLVQINYIINGKMMGKIKWYQRSFTTPVKSRFLNTISYKLSKYVMFY